MSIERDQSTRKAMRAGISGENVLRPLDEFSVRCFQAGEQEKQEKQEALVSLAVANRKAVEAGTFLAMISSGGASGGCPGGYDFGVMR